MRTLTVILALMLLLTGCKSSNLTDLMKAIGDSKDAWCLKGQIGTVYGTESNFVGRGSADTSVEVGPDKCVITGANVKTPK